MGMFDKYLRAAAEESTTVPAAVAEASPDDSAALSLSDETKKSLQRELASVHKASNAEKAEANEQSLDAAIEKMNQDHFVSVEGGVVYVFQEATDLELGRSCLIAKSPANHKALHMNPTFPVRNGPSGDTRNVSLGAAWWASSKRREYVNGMALLPGQTAPDGVYNLWRGWNTKPMAGDCEMALRHIAKVVCNGDVTLAKYVLSWLAWAVQNPGKQAEVALVLQGKKGTGKGTLGRWMLEIFGAHGLHILHRRHLVGNFNAHLRSLCFIFADESFFAGDHEGQAVLKGVITEDQLTIERKGVDAYAVRNRLKVMMATNSEWVVPASEDERRYCVVEVSDCKRGDHKYFSDLEDHMRNGGLAAFLHFLLNLDLSKFNIRRVPNTAALERQKLLSLEPLEAWVYNLLAQGYFNATDEGWQKNQERAALTAAFAEYVKATGKRHVNVCTNTVGKGLRRLFPGLVDKRETNHPRRRIWVFPELDEARQNFSNFVGLEHTQWPEVS